MNLSHLRSHFGSKPGVSMGGKSGAKGGKKGSGKDGGKSGAKGGKKGSGKDGGKEKGKGDGGKGKGRKRGAGATDPRKVARDEEPLKKYIETADWWTIPASSGANTGDLDAGRGAAQRLRLRAPPGPEPAASPVRKTLYGEGANFG